MRKHKQNFEIISFNITLKDIYLILIIWAKIMFTVNVLIIIIIAFINWNFFFNRTKIMEVFFSKFQIRIKTIDFSLSPTLLMILTFLELINFNILKLFLHQEIFFSVKYHWLKMFPLRKIYIMKFSISKNISKWIWNLKI